MPQRFSGDGLGRPPRRRPRRCGLPAAALLALLAATVALTAAAATASAPPGVAVLHPNDPGYQQYPGDYGPTNAPAYWAAITGKSCNVPIYVIDANTPSISDLSVTQGPDYAGQSANSHGTEVASVAGAAINNGVGVPGFSNCPIISIGVLDSTNHLGPDAVSGINWACGQPGPGVVNFSIGGSSSAVDQAIQSCTSKVFVIAAGNQGTSDPSANNFASDNPQAMVVSGIDQNNQLDPTSNYGSWTDIAAMYELPADRPDGSWGLVSGTSFAAPQVSGVAAEMLSMGVQMADVQRLIVCSGTYVPGLDVGSNQYNCPDGQPSTGRVLDAYAALVAAGYKPPPPAALTVTKVGHGKIVDDQGHISCGKACAYPTYAPQGNLTLKAHSARGWIFIHWSGACHGKALTCQLTLNSGASLAVAAKFLPALTIIKRGKGAVKHIPNCGAKTRHCVKPLTGHEVKIAAKPARGWHFVHWAGACRGTHNVCVLKGKKTKRPGRVIAVFKK